MTVDGIPRRERKKAQTRKALLDVALRLIGERGIYGTRVEDITERSDLGKGAFYNYFPSKGALVAALVVQGVDVLCTRYLADVSDLPTTEARISAVLRGHEAFFTEHPVFVILFHQARGVAKIGTDDGELEAVFVAYLRRIGDLLVSEDDAARTSARDRMDLAAVILGSIAGYRSFRLAAGLGTGLAVLNEVLVAGVSSALDAAAPR